MAYIDTKHLFKCETCRSMRSGKCTSFCDSGECYSPDMSKIPTADVVEVKHGRWVSNELGGYKYAFYCSECGWVDGYPFNDRRKYCPHCGAKMDRERTEE